MTVFFRHTKHLLASLALFSVIGMMLAMRPTPTAMERVMTRGELVVMTRQSNTTYYKDQHGYTGMEYELAKGFADSLGVKLRMLESDDPSYIRYAIRKGTADMAAAGLVATAERSESLYFTTDYQKVDSLVVRRLDTPRIRGLEDLVGKRVAVGDRKALVGFQIVAVADLGIEGVELGQVGLLLRELLHRHALLVGVEDLAGGVLVGHLVRLGRERGHLALPLLRQALQLLLGGLELRHLGENHEVSRLERRIQVALIPIGSMRLQHHVDHVRNRIVVERVVVPVIDVRPRPRPDLWIPGLPDGKVITIGSERFRTPEVLFQPSFIGNFRDFEDSVCLF